MAEVQALAAGCATGIASIHQAGLVHGQFGPDMLVLGRDGPRVVHFSTTPPYGAATPAADILAWAQVVAFAAAGHLPTSARDLAALFGRPAPGGGRLPEPRPGGAPACPGPADRTAERGRSVRRAAGRGCPPQPDGRPRPGSGPAGSRRGAAAPWRRSLPRGPVGRRVPGLHRGNRGRGVFHHRTASRYPGAGASPTAGGPLAKANLPIPGQVNGTWSGTIHQTNPSLSLAVRLTLPGGSTRGAFATRRSAARQARPRLGHAFGADLPPGHHLGSEGVACPA